jgi:hypothetical protein
MAKEGDNNPSWHHMLWVPLQLILCRNSDLTKSMPTIKYLNASPWLKDYRHIIISYTANLNFIYLSRKNEIREGPLYLLYVYLL